MLYSYRMPSKVNYSKFSCLYIDKDLYERLRKVARFEYRTIRAQAELWLRPGVEAAIIARKVAEAQPANVSRETNPSAQA